MIWKKIQELSIKAKACFWKATIPAFSCLIPCDFFVTVVIIS